MLSKMEFLIDVEKADASVEADRIRILAAVAAAPGGSAALNRSVQAAVVAAQLCHRHRVVARAAPGRAEARRCMPAGAAAPRPAYGFYRATSPTSPHASPTGRMSAVRTTSPPSLVHNAPPPVVREVAAVAVVTAVTAATASTAAEAAEAAEATEPTTRPLPPGIRHRQDAGAGVPPAPRHLLVHTHSETTRRRAPGYTHAYKARCRPLYPACNRRGFT